MIRYTLNCNNGHQFDSWFSDSASFEKLREKGHLECAICSSKKVEKSLMAPVVTPKKKETLLSKQSALEKEIKALKQKIKATATDVGENFSAEARAMHYGEKEEKPIVGKTTIDEAKELAEEGIPFTPLPWSDDKVN
ncbi:MAG: hypothetical protein CM15mP98_11330 [Paracoccaceae bacterium]|jgi:hypothetical protein|nr:MAG: hypothetical protein CM15mP98_11330 [Paracoccaceae bacterium]|tara:strand:- start:94 stop:504 length:411 start_codon:yes stop_codon:yes gene_type:complete